MSLFQRDLDYLTLLRGVVYCLNPVDVIAANNTHTANSIEVEVNIGDAVGNPVMSWTSVRALVYPGQIQHGSPIRMSGMFLWQNLSTATAPDAQDQQSPPVVHLP